MTEVLSWVVGRGGLLGSSVERAVGLRGPVWRPERPLSWDQGDRSVQQLAAIADRFRRDAAGGDWQVAWCAGAGVTATGLPQLQHELRLFASLLDALEAPELPTASGRGALFLSSSAGALYAGASTPPFTELSEVEPVSSYGENKAELERLARDWATRTGNNVLLGRIANLYGAGQNLSKPQGLISQVCRAQLLRCPISIYVPLDTVRDYIYAPDCGAMVAEALARHRLERDRGGSCSEVKIFATQQGVTVGAVLGEIKRVFKRTPQLVLASSPQSKFQARDLRLRSVVWPELDRRSLTPLPVGIHATITHLRRSLGAGAL